MKSLVALAALILALCSANAAELNLAQIKTAVDLAQYEPDTIIVSTRERRLFYKTQEGEVVAYKVAVGREGFLWSGEAKVARMTEWPDWTATPDMLRREPKLPRFIAGGWGNPLGARALYLFEGKRDTLYRIHGTASSKSIGQAVTSGCIRLLNEDVRRLYTMVRVGTKVVVLK